jgi:hypothetical protein
MISTRFIQSLSSALDLTTEEQEQQTQQPDISKAVRNGVDEIIPVHQLAEKQSELSERVERLEHKINTELKEKENN